MKTLIIIPTYNEEKTIASILKGIKHKVLVVDNASPDDTVKIAKKFGAQVIEHKTNLGKAASLVDGYHYALKNGYDIIITLDADGEHNPRQIPEFIEKISGHDIVLGQRELFRNQKRRLLNFWTHFWFALLAPGIHDIQCGYRAISADLLRKLDLNSKGFNIEMEVLLESIKNKAKINKVLIDTKPREGSMVTFKDYIKMNNFFDMWVLRNQKYLDINLFLKIFLVVAVQVGLVLGIIVERILK